MAIIDKFPKKKRISWIDYEEPKDPEEGQSSLYNFKKKKNGNRKKRV